jgi:hypothetical protein
MAAVTQDGRALEFAPAFQNDREVVMAAVKEIGTALLYASDDLKNDKDVVMAAVTQTGLALQFAPAFQNDKDVVMAAVKQFGLALEFATLRADPDVACAAVKNNPNALEFVDPSLDENDDFIECMMKYNVNPRGRVDLKGHIVDRQSLKNTANTLSDPMKYVVNNFLGGKRKGSRRKRTRRRTIRRTRRR